MTNRLSRWFRERNVRRIEREIKEKKAARAGIRREAKRCTAVIRGYYIGKYALNPGEETVLKAARTGRGVKVREGPQLDSAKSLVTKKLLTSEGQKGLVHFFKLTEGGKCYRTVRRMKRNLPVCMPTKCNGESRSKESRGTSYSSYGTPPSPYEHGSRHYEA